MLQHFISQNREELIARTRKKVEVRRCPLPTGAELLHGVPIFFDQLCSALQVANSGAALKPAWTSEQDPGTKGQSDAEIGHTAAQHGHDLMNMGFSVGQVVHDYGDVCQAITELALERKIAISTDDFRTLNRCLDDAVARAVTEFSSRREALTSRGEVQRLGSVMHELRNGVAGSLLCYDSLRKGRVGINGATGTLLGRSLAGLSELADRALAEVRLEAGISHHAPFKLDTFVAEVSDLVAISAELRGLTLEICAVDEAVHMHGDRAMLASVLTNLLQNACKFTHAHGQVTLGTTCSTNKVLFEIEDACGGLPAGKAETLFAPYQQSSENRTGLGLGLAISRRGAEAWGGKIWVRNLAGRGCVFCVEVPTKAPDTTAPS